MRERDDPARRPGGRANAIRGVETQRRIAEMMIGAELANVERAARPLAGRRAPRRRAPEHRQPEPFGVDLDDISFEARAGEILGIAGVAGNGQKELMLALSGETATRASAVRLDGAPIGRCPLPRGASAAFAPLPEERNGHAAVAAFSLAENTLLTARERKARAPAGDQDRRHARIRKFRDRRVQGGGDGADAPARSLSGGNLQKFVVGREILQEPQVLVVDQPTWGVDAGAAAAIRQALVDLAAQGLVRDRRLAGSRRAFYRSATGSRS